MGAGQDSRRMAATGLNRNPGNGDGITHTTIVIYMTRHEHETTSKNNPSKQALSIELLDFYQQEKNVLIGK